MTSTKQHSTTELIDALTGAATRVPFNEKQFNAARKALEEHIDTLYVEGRRLIDLLDEASPLIKSAELKISSLESELERLRSQLSSSLRRVEELTPKPIFYCNKCGYVGERPLHPDCNYFASECTPPKVVEVMLENFKLKLAADKALSSGMRPPQPIQRSCRMGEKVGGWVTMEDGSRHPISEATARDIYEEAQRQKKERAERLPDDKACLRAMMDGYSRLEELGWKNIIYCPKDGTRFHAIEAGSTGVHVCYYDGKWPDGGWWIEDKDTWPSHPILFHEIASTQSSDNAESPRG